MRMPSFGQFPLIVKQGVLAVTAVGNKFHEDPGNTLLLIAQRLPERIRYKLGESLYRQGRSRTLRAYGAVMTGSKDELAELINEKSPAFLRRSLGVSYAVDGALHGDQDALARSQWSLGDLSAAERVSGRRGARLRDEAAFLRAASTLGSGNSLLQEPAAHVAAGAHQSLDALLVLTNSLSPTNSGYSQRSHEIYSALAARGLKVEAVTRPGYPAVIGKLALGTEVQVPSSINGTPMVYRRLIPWRLYTPLTPALQQHVQMLSELVATRRPAVLHTTTDYKNGVVVRAVARAYGIPWIYEMRGELEKSWVARQPEALRETAENSTRYRALRAIETQLAKDADAVIVLSEYQKQELIARGVAESTITVVPNGTKEVAAGELTREQVRAQLNLGEGFIFGSISSVVDYEQHTLLVHALAELRGQGIEARLAIVGDGVSLAEVKHLAESLGVAQHCIFPGKVDSATARLWYRAIDVFCVPRRRTAVTEVVTPMKSIPALGMGIPVLVSDLPALVEITPPEFRDSWVLPSDDSHAWAEALATFCTRGLPLPPFEHAQRFAANRTWTRAGELISKVYEQVLDSHR